MIIINSKEDILALKESYEIHIFQARIAQDKHILQKGKKMNEWKEVKLGDVCENISRRFDFKNKKKVIFINTGDVLNGKFLHFNYSKKETLPGQAKKAILKMIFCFLK